MTQPSIVNDWPPQLAPWMTPDLNSYVVAIASMWSQTDPYLEDPDNDVVAFQALFDIDLAPFIGLPWLAQCVGERVPVGVSDAQARDWISNSPTWIRGTPQGIWNAVKRELVPGASIQMRERWNANTSTVDPDWVSIIVWASQVPNMGLLQQALRRNIPADIMLDLISQTEEEWATISGSGKTWGQIKTQFATWGQVLGAPPGYIGWA